MTNVVASTAEEDIGESFINAQEEVPECTTLIKMGYPQPPTKIQVDNTTSNAFTKKNLKHNQSKAINVRFYWIKNICAQG